ncbi:Citrinin biosynthesis cluster MFS transporter mrr1 [Coniosporium uncinatum]|uniref:Citrinin biosynthesis cluster MFS transporter mrr1 n=1 Tax=Coniosporium uncinatum TaxID=93489 RepID=A0ACC3E037_9PEZI|nr:Citrinin biosynthesis cluster MFS transporter mrr1 [Coniosporium uncinatum]
MATTLPSGFTRTASGRTTYYPDGVGDETPVRRPSNPYAPRHIPIANFMTRHAREASMSGASHYNDIDFEDDDDKKTVGSASTARNSETHIRYRDGEVPPVPTLPWKRSSDEADLEKQESEQKPDNGEEEKDPNLIEWDGPDDPENPLNFSPMRKWIITISMGLMTFVITFASSVFSTATQPTAREFGVSTEVTTLGTSLFVLGFAVGPIIWGPLSELYGRKVPLFIGYTLFGIFQIPVAVAVNLETIMLCRFFGGVFGSAPLGIVGGALADFWGPVDRGVAVCIFAGATFIGPVAGPIMGGFITMSHLGWRWTAWITMIMAAFFGVIGLFLIPETFAPLLLQKRAKKIRFETKNWAIHAKADESKVDLKTIVQKYLLRPFAMLVMEPILLVVTLYMALIYGILYLFFTVYPITFQQQRGWNAGVGALPFLGILIGVVLGGIFITVATKTRFARKLKEEGHVVPEERLLPMIVGGAIFPAGMFWFAWTSNPNILWVPQVIAGVPIGMGILMIFLQGLNYLIDVYMMNANSAIAANTFVRSFLGGGFPMFAMAMYNKLGVPWATSLLGFLAVALFPAPILFYIYGAKIRKLSKYSPS